MALLNDFVVCHIRNLFHVVTKYTLMLEISTCCIGIGWFIWGWFIFSLHAVAHREIIRDAYVRKWFLENYANYAEDPEFDANGFVIAKTKSQMEAEKKAKAQEEAKRAEEIAAAEAQEETDVQEQEIEKATA